MNTFTKAIFLTLATGSVSAQNISTGGALRAQVAEASSNSPPQKCVPDTRPQTQSKTADKTRFRFNYEKSDVVCADKDGITYEVGEFDKVNDSDQCAEMCTNDTTTFLANVIRGFNYDCDARTCQCLYDEGTIVSNSNGNNAKKFDYTNYPDRTRKGIGSIKNFRRSRGSYCFKLVGAELTGEGLELFQKTHLYLQSFDA
mmetsp:Transcript_19092/g.34410  ORF Transcript_19092/g.34410 Transcript_19092/m.34410 type:complete len:200 (+) Transcript_19092:136-735(+)